MSHMPVAPFERTSGPRNARIAIVGEAEGAEEALAGRPFVGRSGQLLDNLLAAAGIPRKSCFTTNVLAFRPEHNDLGTVCSSKRELGKEYRLPPLKPGKYLRPEYLGELERLRHELEHARPNIVVACGGAASWALLGTHKISTVRGTTAYSGGGTCPISGLKVLPTYHPAYVARVMDERVVVLADFDKVRSEAEFPEVRRPRRRVLVQPTLAQIEIFYSEHLSCPRLSVDIETSHGMIDCIGFAPRIDLALVVPFLIGHEPYWNTVDDEVAAWNYVQKFLDLPCEKVFQNGLFDLTYLLRNGFRVRNAVHDTMLLQHSRYPELERGLGFLGSVYTQEASWKLMRGREQEDLKRGE